MNLDLADLPAPDAYAYRGIRAIVVLHERTLRDFLDDWRLFDASGVALPETHDSSYKSNRHLLEHVLEAAESYLTWVCRQLELPDPGIREVPALNEVAEQADDYLEHLFDRWRKSLVSVPESKMEDKTYPANWGTPMTIEAMLEHAVMHPIRHSFQLDELMTRGAA